MTSSQTGVTKASPIGPKKTAQQLFKEAAAAKEAEEKAEVLRQRISRFLQPSMVKLIESSYLDQLYPLDKATFEKQEIDSIAASISQEDAISGDSRNTTLLALLKQIIFQLKMVPKKDGIMLNKLFEDKNINTTLLTNSLLEFGDGGIFKFLFLEYMIKLPHQLEFTEPTSLQAGELLNMLFSLSDEKSFYLYGYNKMFHRIVSENLDHLGRNLLSFFLLKVTGDSKLGLLKSRALTILTKTVFYCFKSSFRDKFKTMDMLPATVWQVVIDIMLLVSPNHIEDLQNDGGEFEDNTTVVSSTNKASNLVFFPTSNKAISVTESRQSMIPSMAMHPVVSPPANPPVLKQSHPARVEGLPDQNCWTTLASKLWHPGITDAANNCAEILKLCMLHGSQVAVINVLFKLNLCARMKSAVDEVFPDKVLNSKKRKSFPDGVLYNVRKVLQAIQQGLSRSDLQNMQKMIETLPSFKGLQQFVQRLDDKKEGSSLMSQS